MPKSNNRKYSKLNCQHCGKQRRMLQFAAINTEQKDGEPNVYPFVLRNFMQVIHKEAPVRLPRFYAGTCECCHKVTFFEGQHNKSTLVVIPT